MNPLGPLIAAKLKMPALRSGGLRRERLLRRLTSLPDRKATVISGAPGSGKTTLLATYFHEGPPVAGRWVSLDEGDDDVRTLWTYVLEALKPELGPRAGALQQLLASSLQAEDVHSALAEIVNVLQPEAPICLVLDDVHCLTDPRVHESLRFFLRYSAPAVHVALLSRTEPGLYLGDVRMAGQLLEIRDEDLRATPEEARRFLTETLDLEFTEDALHRVTELAEGWLGGLQLLGVAWTGQTELPSAVAPADRAVVEYLSTEILGRLSAEERDFLTATSIVDYVDGDLGGAVGERDDAATLLRRLSEQNSLVVAVDGAAGVYRYHPLLAEALRQRWLTWPADRRRRGHGRAAAFYDAGGHVDKAVDHWLRADRADDALRAVEKVQAGAKRWRLLQKVPLETLHGRPDFVFQRLFSHLAEQQFDRAAEVIETFRGRLEGETAAGLWHLLGALIDRGPFHFDPARWSAGTLTDLPLSDETRAVLYALLAAVLTLAGREGEASACLGEARRSAAAVENPYIRYYCWQFEAQLKEEMGELRTAEAVYEDMFRLAAERPALGPLLLNGHMGVAGVYLKAGRLDAARQHLDAVKPRVAGAPTEAAYWGNEAEYWALKGDGAGTAAALERLASFGALDHPLYGPRLLHLAVALGVADEARVARFLHEGPESPRWRDDGLRALLLLRDGRSDEAMRLVNARLQTMRQRQAKLPLVELLVVKAQIFAQVPGRRSAEGDGREVRNALREAVHYSWEHRLAAPFMLAKQKVARPLRRLRHDARAELGPGERAFLDELLPLVEEGSSASAAPQLGPLSAREADVLRVLAEGATNREIAARLHVSVATVKTHLVHIYSKLHASNRVEAVQKARALGLVPD